MKRITVLAFLTAVLISMASARAHAQALMFRVPFGFTVGNQALPAGTYQVSNVSVHTILIRTIDGRFGVVTTTLADSKGSYGIGKLIFAQYGNQYFLHEVLCSDLAINEEIPRSKREKQVRIREAQLPHSETVAALHVGEK